MLRTHLTGAHLCRRHDPDGQSVCLGRRFRHAAPGISSCHWSGPLAAALDTLRCVSCTQKAASRRKSWSRLEQGLRVTDLLLQAGGFSCIVLDMGSLNAEYALRVPLATWFRFRAAAERLQSNVLLLTQHACSRNSAGLVLRLDPGSVLSDGSTVFTGLEHRAELARQRFPRDNVFPLRKQPQSVQTAQWQARTVWAGCR